MKKTFDKNVISKLEEKELYHCLKKKVHIIFISESLKKVSCFSCLALLIRFTFEDETNGMAKKSSIRSLNVRLNVNSTVFQGIF